MRLKNVLEWMARRFLLAAPEPRGLLLVAFMSKATCHFTAHMYIRLGINVLLSDFIPVYCRETESYVLSETCAEAEMILSQIQNSLISHPSALISYISHAIYTICNSYVRAHTHTHMLTSRLLVHCEITASCGVSFAIWGL